VAAENRTIDVGELLPVAIVDLGLPERLLGKLDLTDRRESVICYPGCIEVGPLIFNRNSLELPRPQFGVLPESTEQRTCGSAAAGKEGEEEIESECLGGVEVMEIPVALALEPVLSLQGLDDWEEVLGRNVDRQDMIPEKVLPPVPEDTGFRHPEIESLVVS